MQGLLAQWRTYAILLSETERSHPPVVFSASRCPSMGRTVPPTLHSVRFPPAPPLPAAPSSARPSNTRRGNLAARARVFGVWQSQDAISLPIGIEKTVQAVPDSTPTLRVASHAAAAVTTSRAIKRRHDARRGSTDETHSLPATDGCENVRSQSLDNDVKPRYRKNLAETSLFAGIWPATEGSGTHEQRCCGRTSATTAAGER